MVCRHNVDTGSEIPANRSSQSDHCGSHDQFQSGTFQSHMKRFAEKLRQVERNLAVKQGEFYLFALLRREDARLYELVIVSAIGLAVEEIRITLGERALLRFTRVFTYPTKTPGLRDIYRDFSADHDLVEIRNELFLGAAIEEGYFLTSRAKLPKEGGKLAVS